LAAVVTAFEEVCIDVIGVVMCGAPWRRDQTNWGTRRASKRAAQPKT
jgi:hypothetical protein